MELELGLALPFYQNANQHSIKGFSEKEETCIKHGLSEKKRSFSNAFRVQAAGGGHESDGANTLPLLVWSGHPNGGDDNAPDHRCSGGPFEYEDEEDKEIVGWPPIKTWRKKLLHGRHAEGCGMRNHYTSNGRPGDRGSTTGRQSRNSNVYVKVMMEGVVIGRKVDLKLFNSYESLHNTLLTMFHKHYNEGDDGSNYVVLYLDKEGEWLVTRDVQWEIFVDSVQRIKIVKQNNVHVDSQLSLLPKYTGIPP